MKFSYAIQNEISKRVLSLVLREIYLSQVLSFLGIGSVFSGQQTRNILTVGKSLLPVGESLVRVVYGLAAAKRQQEATTAKLILLI